MSEIFESLVSVEKTTDLLPFLGELVADMLEVPFSTGLLELFGEIEVEAVEAGGHLQPDQNKDGFLNHYKKCPRGIDW